MKILKVGNTDVLLDDWDWLRLCRKKWRIKKVNPYQSYVVRTYRKKGKHYTVYIHREIINPPDNMEVHHKDGNAFNNQKENLEVLTKEQHGKKLDKKYERKRQ